MRRIKPAWPIALAIALLALLAIPSLWFGLRAAWTDASIMQTRWLVSQWREGTGPVKTPQLWQQTRSSLQDASQSAPDNPQLLDDLGYLDASRALALGVPAAGTDDFTLRQNLLASAITHYRSATRLRPTYPYSWAYLALAKHFAGENDAELWQSFDKALRHGQAEAGVQPVLAQLAFAHWGALGDQRQRLVIAMVATAPETIRKQLKLIAAANNVTL